MDRFLPLLSLILLAACSKPPAPEADTMRDPAIMGALSEPLMSDLDLGGGQPQCNDPGGCHLT